MTEEKTESHFFTMDEISDLSRKPEYLLKWEAAQEAKRDAEDAEDIKLLCLPFTADDNDIGIRALRSEYLPDTVENVREWLKIILSVAGDHATAHSLEDELHRHVLSIIATCEVDDPAELANETLLSLEIDFSRYCA